MPKPTRGTAQVSVNNKWFSTTALLLQRSLDSKLAVWFLDSLTALLSSGKEDIRTYEINFAIGRFAS